jgi:hypothetical protein
MCITQMMADCWTRGCIITCDAKITIFSCILEAIGADNGTAHPNKFFTGALQEKY